MGRTKSFPRKAHLRGARRSPAGVFFYFTRIPGIAPASGESR